MLHSGADGHIYRRCHYNILLQQGHTVKLPNNPFPVVVGVVSALPLLNSILKAIMRIVSGTLAVAVVWTRPNRCGLPPFSTMCFFENLQRAAVKLYWIGSRNSRFYFLRLQMMLKDKAQ